MDMKKNVAVNFADRRRIDQEGRNEIMAKPDESTGPAVEGRVQSVLAPIQPQILHSSDPFRVDYQASPGGFQISVERLNPGILKREQFGPMANAFRDLLTSQCPGLVKSDVRKGTVLSINVNPLTESDKQTIGHITHFLMDKSMFILRKGEPPSEIDIRNEYVNYYSASKFEGDTHPRMG